VKLISTNKELKSNLLRLIKQYPNVSFGTAWASAKTDVFASLVDAKAKIQCAVIGTHFYQTDPDVLDEFVGSTAVKFVLQPQGVFHPKVFAFWDATSWEVLIGSANLTAGAITQNTELCTLVTHLDGTPDLLGEVLEIIRAYGTTARTITQLDTDNYRRIWTLKVKVRDKLEGKFGGIPPTKPELDSQVMTMDWATFYAAIQTDKIHGFEERLDMLEKVAHEFAKAQHFNDIPFQERLGIAGLKSTTIQNSAWFGSMVGAGKFYSLMNHSEPAFSIALDAIPLTGTVTKDDYNTFVERYLTAFPNGRDGLSTATRLLSMKRPDTFLCVDGQNLRKLANDVGMLKQTNLNYERYWIEVVERIQASPWWNAPVPTNETEARAWRGRAAMLDALFYEETI
jgi:hypothetical protein